MLEVTGLRVSSHHGPIIQDASFALAPGSRTGLIGESGSGKTMTALAIMGLLPDGLGMDGSVRFRGEELRDASERRLVELRGNAMSMIFQEPMTALNPVMRIGRQVAEPLRVHQGLSRRDALAMAVDLLDQVGIADPARRAQAYPHELSGGQRQRAMIAMALACGPELVIADEPTTALDVTIQARVLEVLRNQVVARNAALLLITHDLPVVAGVTEEVLVMRDGVIVEAGPTGRVFSEPQHPYTHELVSAVPPLSRSHTLMTRPPAGRPAGPPLIVARGVVREFRLHRRSVFEPPPVIRAVDRVSMEVYQGETFGIVGESGSGKSTLARMLVGLERPTAGSIEVAGVDTSTDDLARLRPLAQMVFQDPMGSLDPRMRVGDIIAEPLRALGLEGDHGARVRELLEAVALPVDSVGRYAHEFSGGQRQRIAIARALAPGPRVLVADEPVSALDMSVQTVTLDLLARLKREFDLTMVFISHDLSVVYEICDRVMVLESGRKVEEGSVGQVFEHPRDPYTRRLLGAIPRLDRATAS